jgi:hypothetical protein
MVFPARSVKSALLSERLLKTRLLTSVGLALLLLLGVAVSTHGEMDMASDPRSLSASVSPHIDAAGVDAGHEATAVTMSESGALVGAALCVFGMLCGLTLLVFARRLLSRRIPTTVGVSARLTLMLPAVAARRHAAVRSLTQLGISRT